jgi:hypothetical protein
LAIRTFAVGPRKFWLRERKLQSSMGDFLQGQQCRRVSLDLVIDGRANRTSCQGEELECDVCVGARADVGSQEQAVMESVPSQEAPRHQHQSRKRKRVPSQQGDVEHSAALQEHQAAQSQLNKERVMRRAEISTSALDLSVLKGKFAKWKGQKCLVCWALGTDQGGQLYSTWKDCQRHTQAAEEQMERVLVQVQTVQMQKYSCCSFCLAPQAICHLWREKHQASGTRTASFERVPGQQCQYLGLVCKVVAAVISQRLGEDEGGVEWQWVQKQMQTQAGFCDSGAAREDKFNRLYRWLGLKMVSNSVELSTMVWFLYHLG